MFPANKIILTWNLKRAYETKTYTILLQLLKTIQFCFFIVICWAQKVQTFIILWKSLYCCKLSVSF